MIKKKKYVLIAEDDVFLSHMMEKALQIQGVTVSVVYNGVEAIKSINAKEPDLLLLDLLMPIVDGYGVLNNIQQRGYRFPVVISSNVSDRMDQAKCKKLGCVGYLVKRDMDDDAFWPVIEKYLR